MFLDDPPLGAQGWFLFGRPVAATDWLVCWDKRAVEMLGQRSPVVVLAPARLVLGWSLRWFLLAQVSAESKAARQAG